MFARLNSPLAVALGLALSGPAAAQQPTDGSMILDLPTRAPSPRAVGEQKPVPVQSAAAPAKSAPLAPSRLDADALAHMLPALAPISEDGGKPDESALRYYAVQGDMRRVNVEIERLVRLYPGWTPPLDLFNIDPSAPPDEDSLWELYTADRIKELRAQIEERKKNEPGWEPSKDLAAKTRRKELRARIMDYWREGRWQDLVDFVKQDGYSADDADVELLWTIAEAFAKTKQTPEAVSVYASVLNSAADAPARLATIHKAMANLRMADVEPLIALGRTDASGRSEFTPILVDIVRARISAYLHDERIEKIPQDQLEAFEEYARLAPDPNQPGLVAWYFYKTKVFRDALEWFKQALERGGDAMIAHGLAHSLRELDMRRETEEVAHAWREPLTNNLILFIDILERDLTLEVPPYIEPERLARYAQVTMEVASGEGAQALAWYAYNSCQYEVAHQWFQRAVAWFPKEATVYGYALTLKRLKRDKEFWELQNRYDGLFGKVLEMIFPDGYYHPPTPCDEMARARLRPQNMGGYVAPAPYAYNQLRPGVPGNGLTAAQAAGYMQQPYAGQRQEQPKIDSKLFPASTPPENMLRFASSARPVPRAAAQNAPAGQGPLAQEPVRAGWALVASRVPGVGPMPYERYGYALLPGWNGVTGPTSPTYAAQIAPKGTLWDTELPEKDRPKTALLAGFQNSSTSGGGANGGGAQRSAQNGGPDASPPTSVPLLPKAAPNSANALPPQAPPQAPNVRSVGGAIGVAPMGSVSTAPSANPANPSGVNPPLANPQPVGAQPVNAQPIHAPQYAPRAQNPSPSLPEAADAGTLAQRAMTYFNEKNYQAALETLDKRALTAPETMELRMIRGWSLLHLERRDEARMVFATLSKTPVATKRGDE